MFIVYLVTSSLPGESRTEKRENKISNGLIIKRQWMKACFLRPRA